MRTFRYPGTIFFLLLLAFSLTACGGNSGTSGTGAATPTASTQQAATGPKGLPLYCPLAVAVDAQDNLFVSDNDANMVHERVVKLTPAGQVLEEWHLFPPANIGMTQGPGGLALDAQGNLYVIDTGKYQVVKVSPAGKVLTRWGSYGNGPGQFKGPEAITVDSRGTVYVADNNEKPRVEKFSNTGAFLGTVAMQFNSDPIGLTVDSSDNLYVAHNITITQFSSAGKVTGSTHLTQTASNATTYWTGLTSNARGDFAAATLTIPRFDSGFYPRVDRLSLSTGSITAVLNVWQTGVERITSIALDSQGNLYVVELMKTGGAQLQKFSPSGTVLATLRGACTAS